MKIVRSLIVLIYLTGQIAYANGSSNNCQSVFSNIFADLTLYPNGPHGGVKKGVATNEARSSEKSGFASDGEVLEALSGLSITTAYYHAHHKAYLTGSYGTHEISLQGNAWGGFAFHDAKNVPMQPFQVRENGPYIVYFSYKKIGSTGIWAHNFKVFANKDLAEKFIATHDFETEPAP